MEKLIELYYEHKLDLLKRDMRGNWATEREIELADIEKVEEDELEKNLNKLSELKPFIKWLVENDKLDVKALIVKGEMRSWWDFDNKKWNEESGEEIWNKYYSELCLMLLSISDNPIDLLTSILK